MIDEPVLETLIGRPAAVLHMLIPKDAIQAEMGPAYTELMAAVAAQGIGPAGP